MPIDRLVDEIGDLELGKSPAKKASSNRSQRSNPKTKKKRKTGNVQITIEHTKPASDSHGKKGDIARLVNQPTTMVERYLFKDFSHHPRVTRWQSKEPNFISEFTDFKETGLVYLYKNNTVTRNMELRRYHHLPGLVDVFSSPEFREQYTFPLKSSDNCALGMLTEFYHLDNSKPVFGYIALVGDPKKQQIYHCMFNPLSEKKASLREVNDEIASLMIEQGAVPFQFSEESKDEGIQKIESSEKPEKEDIWHIGKASYNLLPQEILEVRFPEEQHFVRLHRIK